MSTFTCMWRTRLTISIVVDYVYARGGVASER